MITLRSHIFVKTGHLSGYTNQKLYVIQYHNSTLYVGQSTGKRGYNLPCRLGRHFSLDLDDCLRQNDRSGASRQFNIMFSKLPDEVQCDFTLILLNPSDLSNFVDFDDPQIRLKMISKGISLDDIETNITTKRVIDFCEMALAWSLCPTFDKSHNSKCSNGIPDELIKFLMNQNTQ